MKSDSIAYVVAGICFGVILGWVIGTQQARRSTISPAAASPAVSQTTGTRAQEPPRLDEGRVQELNATLKQNPGDVTATIQLGNVYFDAERWDDAITWYRRALELDPDNPDASTDLGVSYYYTNRLDQALAQFERSLKMSPTHTKTLLNKGIVLAFGKQDLKAAAVEWQKVVELAPNSPEGQAARRALDGIASAAHSNSGGTTGNP
jgi:cytochrome c-type biogenesis protein CcmH/NrfG